tara:strand:+ start:452 stop:706 length:255 start_codon:yes stop_codon:yes gene_type:complete
MRTLFLAIAVTACATTEEATTTEAADNFQTVEQTENGFVNTTTGEDFTVNAVENDPDATEKALKAVEEVVQEEFPDDEETETNE